MKKLTITLFATLLTIITYSQNTHIPFYHNNPDSLNAKSQDPLVNWGTLFEPPYDGSSHLGTFYMVNPFNAPGNLWQVGRPLKLPPLDTTVTPPNALLTDTVNSYPVNCHSSFELHFGREPGYENVCWSYMLFGIRYRIDADSARDGFYIEIMYNGNGQWKNIIFDTTMADIIDTNYYRTYRPIDTLCNGEPGISFQNPLGIDQGWNYFEITWRWNNSHAHLVDSVAFRITFVSDSVDTHKGGVLIDGISLFVEGTCNANVDEMQADNYIKLYPNPVNSESIIDFTNPSDYKVLITDISGKSFYNGNFNGSYFPLGSLNLKQGIYCYRISDKQHCFNGKFMVQP